MNTRVIHIVMLASTFSAAGLTPGILRAQETQGPLPATPPQAPPLEPGPISHSADALSAKPKAPRTSIVGAWTLNTDQSDDGRRKLEQAQAKSQNSAGRSGNPRTGGGSPYPGGGGGNPYPGGGGGNTYPGGGGRQGAISQISDADRSELRELTDPPDALSISQKDPKGAEVDVTDDLARKRVFLTDGRKAAKSSDDTYQEIEAKWDGRSLVSDEKTSRGQFSRTFELAPNGQQLYETIRIDASAYGGSRSAQQVYIQYVYDADQGEPR
ncbi:MAG: hypothetical protein WCD49_08050 [Candidatus Acidiferrales bacterium]